MNIPLRGTLCCRACASGTVPAFEMTPAAAATDTRSGGNPPATETMKDAYEQRHRRTQAKLAQTESIGPTRRRGRRQGAGRRDRRRAAAGQCRRSTRRFRWCSRKPPACRSRHRCAASRASCRRGRGDAGNAKLQPRRVGTRHLGQHRSALSRQPAAVGGRRQHGQRRGGDGGNPSRSAPAPT